MHPRRQGRAEARKVFDAHWQDLGHGLLLKRYRDDIGNATLEQIAQAAMDTVPRVLPSTLHRAWSCTRSWTLLGFTALYTTLLVIAVKMLLILFALSSASSHNAY
ncbi:cytochrome D ubiquinol oxidase subunit I [Xanthomonas fragariae]|uniref:Cytochrome D ubiquinol oxidase subunit I n=1 Tax=Xanthomonas fragariae TaxID=48664 RepID=A0A1Y6H5S1_9XANT|nr:hypothetical protein BER92_07655 [Xanthomonas fragariae]ENZ94824.1 cytochrome D ubiquinol oxidase, subunit II [Xanthomonas fragariae LMG 25863]AOD18027.1 hypothetical protein BER93_07680 [Xanthomonas fragariae]SMQ94973.1 cytochrome D ubiquinol oxidase subunit I [Xanthomonas fragariae]SMQ98869.1 Cytochrome bd-I ubiquinol oxidase subunit 1 [Xanthomonas fragariae]